MIWALGLPLNPVPISLRSWQAITGRLPHIKTLSFRTLVLKCIDFVMTLIEFPGNQWQKQICCGQLILGCALQINPDCSTGGRTGQREELNGDTATSRPQLIPLFHGELSVFQSCLRLRCEALVFVPTPIKATCYWLDAATVGRGNEAREQALGEVPLFGRGNSLKLTHLRIFPDLHVTCREWVFTPNIGSGRHTTCILQFTGKEVRIVSTCDSSQELPCSAGCFP